MAHLEPSKFSSPQKGEPESHDSLVRRIRDYQGERSGPTDMWLPLFYTLTSETARGFFDSLPDDLKLLMRREYFGPAHYRFEPPEVSAELNVAKVIARWCEEQGDPDQCRSRNDKRGLSPEAGPRPVSATLWDTAPPAASATTKPLQTMAPRRILVVNNDEGSAKKLATQLGKMGHEVQIACDGPSALELEPTFRPGMVIIDLGLSGIDACTVARCLRAQTDRDVMLVADGGSYEDHARAEQAGCFNDHVSRFHGMPLIQSGGVKLADEAPEDWVRFELCAYPKDDFALRMLAAAAGRFDPAELAPLIPDEFLGEIRRLAESPTDLANHLAGLKHPISEVREHILEGTSRWFRFFNP